MGLTLQGANFKWSFKTHREFFLMCVWVFTCPHMYMFIHIYTYIFIHLKIRIFLYEYKIRMNKYTYICMWVCVWGYSFFPAGVFRFYKITFILCGHLVLLSSKRFRWSLVQQAKGNNFQFEVPVGFKHVAFCSVFSPHWCLLTLLLPFFNLLAMFSKLCLFLLFHHSSLLIHFPADSLWSLHSMWLTGEERKVHEKF